MTKESTGNEKRTAIGGLVDPIVRRDDSTLLCVLNMVRGIKNATGMKVNRHFEGFFADRIVQSFAQPTLMDAIEHLCKAVNASIEYVGGKRTAGFMGAVNRPDANAVLQWIRDHPRITAMVAGLKDDDDYKEAVESISIKADDVDDSTITAQPAYKISINAELLSPLAHGSDSKAGNATLFRRRQAVTETGRILSLPFYAGNAVRGQMRDLLGDHLLSTLGLTPRKDNPPVNLWFFHALYAGGVLEEQSKVTEKVMGGLNQELGKHGALRTDGLRRLRDMLPALSLLGAAMGNRILPGRMQVGDLRPCCHEWGSGKIPAAQLMEWTFLTRRDDYEGRGEDEAHAGMIANTECLKSGSRLSGGIDFDNHICELEMSALGCGLALLSSRGMLGAENRRGLGKVQLKIENAPDPAPYIDYLNDNKTTILDYLLEIGATNAPS